MSNATGRIVLGVVQPNASKLGLISSTLSSTVLLQKSFKLAERVQMSLGLGRLDGCITGMLYAIVCHKLESNRGHQSTSNRRVMFTSWQDDIMTV